jgi:hypothetical protein
LEIGLHAGIDHVVAKGVQYRSLVVPGFSDRRKIVKVDMAVDQEPWLEGTHKPEERPETPVAGVAFVVYALRRGMGQEYVQIPAAENPVKKQRRYHLDDLAGHFEVGELVFPVIVPHGTPKPHNDKAFFAADMGTYVRGAGSVFAGYGIESEEVSIFRGIVGVFFEVMVAEYKEQGFI